MRYITVTKEEAITVKDGAEILKDGYEKWAYVYKRVIPDTEEEIEERKYEAKVKTKEKEILRKLAIAELDALK